MKKVRLFITGIGGTAGRALAKLLVSEKYHVGGTIHHHVPDELKYLTDQDLLEYYPVDLNDLSETKSVIKDFQPDVVIHLAGKVLGRSDKQTSNPAVYAENLKLFQNVLSSAKEIKSCSKFILSSGCLVYNKATSPKYIAEISPMKLPEIDPIKEPYRASKLDQEKLLIKSNINYIIARPTQFTGPGKIPGVIEFYIAKEILGILAGKQKTISVRNKFGEVDMLDVRDIAQAYLTLIKKGDVGKIYHISSGHPVTVERLAKTFLEVVGLNSNKFLINSTDNEQTSYFRFSPARLESLGWNPRYNLKDALTSYWEYFKNQEG